MERTLKSLVLIRAKRLAESVTTPSFLADNQGDLIFYNEAAEVLLSRIRGRRPHAGFGVGGHLRRSGQRRRAGEPPALAASGTTIELTAAAAAPI